MSIRADIVSALSTLRIEWRGEEIALNPDKDNKYTKDPPAPFVAWPQWQADQPADGVVNSSWQVTVILPPAEGEPHNTRVPDTAALDAVRWQVRDALTELGNVGRAELSQYVVEDFAVMPAIRYSLTIPIKAAGSND